MRFTWKITAAVLAFCILAFTVNPLWASGAITEDVAAESPDKTKREIIEILTSDGSKHEFHVELAQTPIEQATGLMYRTALAPDHGMLFLFPDNSIRHFWMKNTLIPLDMIFIKQDGTIAHIHENAVPHDLRSISSQESVKAVLEIPGGTVQHLGLAAGDRIVNSRFFQQ